MPTMAGKPLDDRLRDRVAKLLALADAPGSEAEGATALAQAQRLLLRHNLTLAQFGAEQRSRDGVSLEVVGAWRRLLLGVLSIESLCVAIVATPVEGGTPTVWLFGRPENVEAVQEMYAWIIPQLERLAAEREAERQAVIAAVYADWPPEEYGSRAKAILVFEKDIDPAESGRKYKAGFYCGATAAIGARLKREREKFEEDEFTIDGPTKALVLANEFEQAQKEALAAFGEDEIGEVEHHAGEGSTGIAAGVEAGRDLQLRPVRELRARVPEGDPDVS